MTDHPTRVTEPLDAFVEAVRRSKWLVASLGVMGALIAFYVLQKQPDRYYAQASVQLSDARAAVAGVNPGYANAGMGPWIDPVRTRIEVLRSRGVAEEAVNSSDLRLRMLTPGATKEPLADVRVAQKQPADTLTFRFSSTGFTVGSVLGETTAAYDQPVTVGGITLTWMARPEFAAASIAVLPFEDAIAEVMQNLTAESRTATAIVDIKFIDPDPAGARRGVNAIAAAFKSSNAASVRQMSRRRRVFLEDQLLGTDSALSAAELRLAEFRRGLESYSAQRSFEAEQSELAHLKEQRDSLTREYALYESLLTALSARSADGSRGYAITGELRPAIAALYAQLNTEQRTLDSLTTGAYARTSRHPDVVRVSARKTATERELERALRSQLLGLQTSMTGVNSDRDRSSAALSALPDAQTSEMQLSREVESYRRAEERLRDELQAARVAEAVEAGEVEILDLAQASIGPIGPNKLRTMVLGLLLGLTLGSLAAIVLNRLNTSIRRPEEIHRQFPGSSGLFVIPAFATGSYQTVRGLLPARFKRSLQADTHALAALDSASNGAEAYRRLMTSIAFSAESEAIRVIAVCSPAPGEGKTTTSVNLAITYAQHGRRVLLVDADLRRGCIHEMLDVQRAPGLAEMLASDVSSVVEPQPTNVPGLFVVSRGTSSVHPLDLLASGRFAALLDQWSGEYQMIIVDTPAMLYAAEASLTAARAGGVLIVLRAGRTDQASVISASQQIEDLGGRVLRVIMNDPDSQVATQPRYGYGSYYATID